jgi:hypothetical protein
LTLRLPLQRHTWVVLRQLPLPKGRLEALLHSSHQPLVPCSLYCVALYTAHWGGCSCVHECICCWY